MLLFKDVMTKGEVCTDSFKLEEDQDGALWNIASKRVQVGGDGNVDIGCGNAFGGPEEELDDNVETELDVVAYHKLMKMDYVKKEYKALMKKYWPALKSQLQQRKKDAEESKLQSEIDEAKATFKLFKKSYEKLVAFVKDVVDNFDEYDFYVCEGAMEHDTPLIIPASYPNGAVNPTFHIIRAGLFAQKF